MKPMTKEEHLKQFCELWEKIVGIPCVNLLGTANWVLLRQTLDALYDSRGNDK